VIRAAQAAARADAETAALLSAAAPEPEGRGARPRRSKDGAEPVNVAQEDGAEEATIEEALYALFPWRRPGIPRAERAAMKAEAQRLSQAEFYERHNARSLWPRQYAPALEAGR
jgi:hypothetical protein